jgi:hypothetical protein
MTDERQPMRRYLVVRLNWLQGQGASIYLDLSSVTDSWESAVNHAEANGGFLLEADWWPAPGDPRREQSGSGDSVASTRGNSN